MMSKQEAMAPMMACRIEAMPFTIAMRQEPMARRTPSIYSCHVSRDSLISAQTKQWRGAGMGEWKTYARYDGTHFECMLLSVFLRLFVLFCIMLWYEVLRLCFGLEIDDFV